MFDPCLVPAALTVRILPAPVPTPPPSYLSLSLAEWRSCDPEPAFVPSVSVQWFCSITETHTLIPSASILLKAPAPVPYSGGLAPQVAPPKGRCRAQRPEGWSPGIPRLGGGFCFCFSHLQGWGESEPEHTLFTVYCPLLTSRSPWNWVDELARWLSELGQSLPSLMT